MENQGRKTIALFIVLTAFYLALFDWDWPSISDFRFNLAYTVGMAAALLFCMAERFLKYARTSEFSWWKLIKTHVLAFIVFYPLSIVVILPTLEPPRGVWKLDYKLAFLLTYFFINVGSRVTTIYERLDKFLTPKNGNRKEGC
ncbi:MAG: hypothetical protein AAB797_04080 [Patescibacteria group bacterium]